MQQLRRDPLHGQWVIMAPGGEQRPNAPVPTMPPLEQSGRCPFCPGNEADTLAEIEAVRPTPSAADGPGWTVRVVPHDNPALSIDAVSDEHLLHDVAELRRLQPGVGAHELVISTTEHDARPGSLSIDQWDAVLVTCQYRMQCLMADPRLKHVLLFENCGALAGATREHPHLQMVATTMTPQLIAKEILNCRAYAGRKEQCMLCDLAARESLEAARIVLADDSFISMVPFAAREPYEVWILPRVHRCSFMQVPPRERRRLAAHLRSILRLLETALPGLSYNWVLHTAPQTAGDPEVYHWHIEVLPRLVIRSGFELGTGYTVNPVTPESAAERLRATRQDQLDGS